MGEVEVVYTDVPETRCSPWNMRDVQRSSDQKSHCG